MNAIQNQVKKRQQKVMMILESKQIPYEAIDITEAGEISLSCKMPENSS